LSSTGFGSAGRSWNGAIFALVSSAASVSRSSLRELAEVDAAGLLLQGREAAGHRDPVEFELMSRLAR
jgi:hypothetical protein